MSAQQAFLSTLVTPRNTTGGAACRLPIVVEGQLQADCTTSKGIEVCYTVDLKQTRACVGAPDAPSRLSIGTLLASGLGADEGDGSLCTLGTQPTDPVLACREGFECTAFDNEGATEAGYGYCEPAAAEPTQQASAPAPVPAPGPADSEALQALYRLRVAERYTNTRERCRLPVVREGQLLTDCVEVNGTSSCFTANFTQTGFCDRASRGSRLSLGTLLTTGLASDGGEGALCSNAAGGTVGKVVCLPGFTCTPAPAGSLLVGTGFGFCANLLASVGNHEAVMALSALPVSQRFTLSGQACRLPLVYREQLLTDCSTSLAATGQARCFVGDSSEPQACLPSNATSAAPASAAQLLAEGSAGFDGQSGMAAPCHAPTCSWWMCIFAGIDLTASIMMHMPEPCQATGTADTCTFRCITSILPTPA